MVLLIYLGDYIYMKLTELEKNYIFTTKVEVLPGATVTLREPNMQEFSALSKVDPEKDSAKFLEELGKLFPICVVDTDVENENGEKATGKELAGLLAQSSTGWINILTSWFQACPFQSAQKKQGK